MGASSRSLVLPTCPSRRRGLDAQGRAAHGRQPHRECDSGLPQGELGHPDHLVSRVEVGLLEVDVGSALEVTSLLEVPTVLELSLRTASLPRYWHVEGHDTRALACELGD